MTRIDYDAARANLDNLAIAAIAAFANGALTGIEYVALSLDIAARRAKLRADFDRQAP